MRRKWFRIGVLAVLLTLLGPPLFLAIDILYFSYQRSETPSDAAVVLGAAVWTDRPSPVFVERIKHAVQLYEAGIVDRLVFTGGLADYDQLAESEAAEAYAIAQGVPGAHIYIETVSSNTCLNLVEAKRIMEANGLEQALIVSDPMHMKRAMWQAGQIGMSALSSPTPTSRYQSLKSRAGFLFQEVYYYGAYLLRFNTCP